MYYYLLNILHNLNSRCSKWFGKSFTRERAREREIKENLFQQLMTIQRQWCYRAPIKKLSLHWQWYLFQPLLTTLLVPVCESQPTASHSVFSLDEASSAHVIQTQTGKSSYSSSWTSRCETQRAAFIGKVCSLSSGICHWNTGDLCGRMWKVTRWMVVIGD